MKNDTGSRIFNRHVAKRVNCAVLLCFSAQILSPVIAFADTALPPPSVQQNQGVGFPSEQALKRQGYDPSTGVWRVDERNTGSSTVTKNGGTIKGTQPKTVTVTGNYGEKGTMSTSFKQNVGLNTLNTVTNIAVLGHISGQNQGNLPQQLGENIRNGDLKGAFNNAMDIVGNVLNNIGGGIPSSIADGFSGRAGLSKSADNFFKEIYNISSSNQSAAEKAGDFGGAVAHAGAKKAADAAADAAAKQRDYEDAKKNLSGVKAIYSVRVGISQYGNGAKSTNEAIGVYTDNPLKGGVATASYDKDGNMRIISNSPLAQYLPKNLKNAQASAYYEIISYSGITPPNINPDNFVLTNGEIAEILKRMLESQNTNHKELMNQLSRIGDAVQKSTESTEFTPTSVTTEPYTPAGSNTPQQTQFTIDKNGNVSAKTIPRPDLKPHSSQAPTRSEVIKSPTAQAQQVQQGQTGQNTSTGEQAPTTGSQTGQVPAPTTGTPTTQNQTEQQKFCEQNPNVASCLDIGQADYEDLEVPINTINFDFKPSQHFITTGVCPAPKRFDFGKWGSYEFRYDSICMFAEGIRPMLILVVMAFCSIFAYGAVKEL